MPVAIRHGVDVMVHTPGLRRFLITRHDFAPTCSQETLAKLLLELDLPRRRSLVFYQSRWQSDHFSILVYSASKAFGFVQVRPEPERFPYPVDQMPAFRFPKVMGEVLLDGWHARLVEPLPGFHRPFAWNSASVSEIASQASHTLMSVLSRPIGVPDNWRPIHGDLTPWNLRTDRRGRVWLIDWERARFGPPLADAFRHAITDATLTLPEPKLVAEEVAERLGHVGQSLRDSALFWLTHPIFADVEKMRMSGSRQLGSDSDVSRAMVEYDATRVLAEVR